VLILEADASGAWHTVAVIGNLVIWAMFALELGVILFAARRKGAALRAHWLDVAIVGLTGPWFGAFLSSLRFMRLARLLRFLRATVIVSRAIQAERSLTSRSVFRLVALVTVFIVVVAGSAQAAFDAGSSTASGTASWSIVTVTTVGYGDLYPKTVAGRLIAIVVMFVGIGFLSVLTATFASYFVKTDSSDPEVLATLHRIEAELADLKARLPR
jgi:voltage-gated potassium channel